MHTEKPSASQEGGLVRSQPAPCALISVFKPWELWVHEFLYSSSPPVLLGHSNSSRLIGSQCTRSHPCFPKPTSQPTLSTFCASGLLHLLGLDLPPSDLCHIPTHTFRLHLKVHSPSWGFLRMPDGDARASPLTLHPSALFCPYHVFRFSSLSVCSLLADVDPKRCSTSQPQNLGKC